jgi:hypothetical protein
MRREIIQDARQADPWKTDEKTNTGNNWNAGCETKQSTVEYDGKKSSDSLLEKVLGSSTWIR